MPALLLVNLGTPQAPETGPVRTYLREFLSDPRVIDLSPLGRWALVNLVVLPFRPAKSAAAYREIWTERGSPLLFHSQDLADQVRALLGQGWHVELAMRYGTPDIVSGLQRIQAAGHDHAWVLPLYPHYASSSTGSTLEKVYAEAARLPVPLRLHAMGDFYEDPGFIAAQADLARDAVGRADHVLFSYHGIPERQVTYTDFGQSCLSPGCCDAIGPDNRACYRAQCYATTRALCAALDLPQDRISVSFQSRLGRTPWIQPYTDHVLPKLAEQGVRTLAVLTPSFVADCLETVEEIGIRAVQDFQAAGGTELIRVPCVNSSPRWAQAVVDMVHAARG